MKVISWNCCMKFREKFKEISKLDADIYVIPECEDPKQSNDEEYKSFASNHIWIGDNKNKGLGIFAKDDITIEPIPHNSNSKYFIPVRIKNSFNLIAVWTVPEKKGIQYYTEELLNFYNDNESLFDEDLIICGDLNADMSLGGTHAKHFYDFIEKMERHGLRDIYHRINDEDEGYERQDTYYPNNGQKPYHLDHVFAKPHVITYLRILNRKWLEKSDHLPLIFEVDIWPKIESEMKICPECNRLYIEKDECPDCNLELDSLNRCADSLDKYLEHRRGLHITYIDPSYAEEHKINMIRIYYNAYMKLLKADYQNRERYLYGLVKTYDIIDKGYNYTDELDHIRVLEILDRLLEINPNRQEYLRLKVYYSFHKGRYEDVLKYVDKILEIDSEDEEYNYYKESSLEEIKNSVCS